MNATEWTLVKSLFVRALEVQTHQREQWLCDQGDLPESVIAEVRRLLQHAESDPSPHPSPPLRGDRTLQPGSKLHGRFLIHQLLGRGGMGEVYLAHDSLVGIKVAVKTVRQDIAAEAMFASRLEQEIRAARRVKHQNVCALFDLHIEPGGLSYLSMEYVEGPTLAERLRKGPLKPGEFHSFAVQLAAGLDAIHRAGIVHRDLKSSNIFLAKGPEPRVVIADFGLAYDSHRHITETVSLFGPQAIVGTPSYMAPEQLLGRSSGKPADIHAFGVVLYEAATGQLPFPGETPLAIALRRLEKATAPSPCEVNSDVPASWGFAIQSCLAKDPGKRPATAADAIRLFEAPPPPKRMSRRAVLTAAGAAAAVAISGAGAVAYFRGRAAEPNPQALYHSKRGLEYLRRTSNREILAAIKEFRRSVEIDPSYAEGWANLADAYCAAANHVAMPGRVARKEAEAAARTSLALNGSVAAAHTALAYVLATDPHRWAEADQSFQKALSVAPTSAILRSRYASYLGRRGRFKDAIAMARSAITLEPAQFRITVQLGAELFRARKFREMREHMLQVVDLHPTEASGYLSLARAYEFLKEYDEAGAALDAAERLLDEGDASAFRATLLCAKGRAADAVPLADRYLNGWREGKHESNTAASVEGSLRRVDNVFAIIEAAQANDDDTALAIPTNPYLTYLREEPRMRAFRKRLGLA